jgi:hypothetical protein
MIAASPSAPKQRHTNPLTSDFEDAQAPCNATSFCRVRLLAAMAGGADGPERKPAPLLRALVALGLEAGDDCGIG